MSLLDILKRLTSMLRVHNKISHKVIFSSQDRIWYKVVSIKNLMMEKECFSSFFFKDRSIKYVKVYFFWGG